MGRSGDPARLSAEPAADSKAHTDTQCRNESGGALAGKRTGRCRRSRGRLAVLTVPFQQAFRFPRRLAAALASDPAAVLEKLQDKLVQRWEYRRPVHLHESLPDWERRLHQALALSPDCAASAEF